MKNPSAQSLLTVRRWPYSAPTRKNGATLRVMDGSPEKSCIVFEMARFVAGSIALATRKMSSSLSLNSRLFSTLSLWYSEFEKNDKPRNKSPSWEIAEKILKLIPLVKQEERKQTEPKPNQKLDLEASFHIIKSVTSCPILCRLLRSSSLAFGDELEEGTEGTKLNFSFLDRPLCRLFLNFPISSAIPKSLSSLTSCSTLLRGLRVFLGEAHPNTPIWLILLLHRLRDPVASRGSSPMSILSVSRVLDLRSGEGERSKSSWRGRGLEGDRVLLGDSVLRSREILGLSWPP